MCVDVSSYRDAAVTHQLFRNVNGYASSLQICTESMSQAIKSKVRCDRMVNDLAILCFCSHVKVQFFGERIP